MGSEKHLRRPRTADASSNTANRFAGEQRKTVRISGLERRERQRGEIERCGNSMNRTHGLVDDMDVVTAFSSNLICKNLMDFMLSTFHSAAV
uniref:Uncharacterized protein n=1 Tax=Helianthus annuus TaxID=4232 RepID=A0A251RLR7_HELAN